MGGEEGREKTDRVKEKEETWERRKSRRSEKRREYINRETLEKKPRK